MTLRTSNPADLARQGVRDALIRLRAMIAVLDEELRATAPPHQQSAAGLLRPDLDVATVLRDLEFEMSMMSAQAEVLRQQRDEELELHADWPRRRQMAEREGRSDLAGHARIQEAQSQRNADELTRELDEFETLSREHGVLVAELRRRTGAA